MRGNALLAMMATILFLSVSCGKKATEVYSAPNSQYQAGIIASCTTKTRAYEIAEELGGQFRVINEEKKLMEFRGIDGEALKELLPRARFLQNKVYDSLVETSSFNVEASYASNEPFHGAGIPIYRNGTSSSYFPHLDQIDGVTTPNGKAGEGVIIAVIDTGVHYNHQDLSPNILTNSNGNLIGYDFYNGDNYPNDDHGHGTHVAGLAAGTRSGVAPKAKIMPIKVLNSNGQGDIATIAAGILYALDMGADIINLSLGGVGSQMAQRDIESLISGVRLAEAKGRLLVAAAGNGGDDSVGDCNDEDPIYPSSFQTDSIISVAAVDSYNNLTYYSNYGGSTVHIAAPGGNNNYDGLYSTAINGGYLSMAGTSMATPLVSGLAALIKSSNPNLSSKQIRNIIFSTGKSSNSLQGVTETGKVINVRNAINAI